MQACKSPTCHRKSKESNEKKRPLRSITSPLLGLLTLLVMPLPLQAAEIMTTLPPLAGLVQMLQPDAETGCLLPANADPHHFQLSPRQTEQLRSASLLLRASRDDGGWPQLPTQGTTLDLWPEIDHGWLSPAAVRDLLPRLAKVLAANADAANAEKIRSRLPQALAEVAAIDAAWREILAPLREKGAIVQHPAWQRLLNEYGVPVHAALEAHQHGHESGPHILEHALETLEAHPDAWLLGDTRHSNRSLEWLARRSGKQVHYLDPLGQCGTSWPALMQQNIERLRARKA